MIRDRRPRDFAERGWITFHLRIAGLSVRHLEHERSWAGEKLDGGLSDTTMSGRPFSSSIVAGHDGGRIVFEGTPAALVAARSTLTGKHLAAYVGT